MSQRVVRYVSLFWWFIYLSVHASLIRRYSPLNVVSVYRPVGTAHTFVGTCLTRLRVRVSLVCRYMSYSSVGTSHFLFCRSTRLLLALTHTVYRYMSHKSGDTSHLLGGLPTCRYVLTRPSVHVSPRPSVPLTLNLPENWRATSVPRERRGPALEWRRRRLLLRPTRRRTRLHLRWRYDARERGALVEEEEEGRWPMGIGER